MNLFFNAHHSPVGAHASFTLGFPGAKGGLGLELGKPADQDVYIGVESRDGTCFEALPFFAGSEDESKRYVVQEQGDQGIRKRPPGVQGLEGEAKRQQIKDKGDELLIDVSKRDPMLAVRRKDEHQ